MADYLLKGRQTSTLSDVDPTIADVTNDQRNGYGIRASVYYEKDRWSLGPWIQYWDIKQSDAAPILARPQVGPLALLYEHSAP